MNQKPGKTPSQNKAIVGKSSPSVTGKATPMTSVPQRKPNKHMTGQELLAKAMHGARKHG